MGGGDEDGKSGRTSKAAIRRLTHLLDFYFHEFNVCHNRYLLHVLETQQKSKFTLEQLGEFPRIHRILSGLDRKTTIALLRAAVETLGHLSVDDQGALVLDPRARPEVPKFVGVEGFDAEALVRSPVVLHDHSQKGGQWDGQGGGMATVQHSNEHLPPDVFTVLGYNVLADLHARPELFPHCTADDLKWSQRRAKLKREIIYHHADVVCLHDLQSDRDGLGNTMVRPKPSEDDHLAYFAEALAEASYGGTLYRRRRPAPGATTSELETGSAIFWDTTRMESLRQWSWSLSEDAEILSEYREVAVCALLKHRLTQKPVLVCASRFSNSQSEDVLAWQGHALLRRLARIRDALVVPVPLVLSVDLNAGVESAAYRAISQGLLDFEEPTPVPSSLAPADQEGRKAEAYAKFSQRADRLFEELEQCQLIPRPARQSHKHATFHPSLPLQDVYTTVMQTPPPFSVYTQREQRLRDHLFCTGVAPMAVLAGVYAHIQEHQRGMPCSRFPSSHLPLIAAFRMP